ARGAISDAQVALNAKAKQFGELAELRPRLARGVAYLSLHRAQDALADLEIALALGEKHAGDKVLRADVRAAVAQALVETRGDRARAASLAAQAATDFDEVGLPDAARHVRAWMTASGLGGAGAPTQAAPPASSGR
ncbi:MAG: hypothetical protein ACLQVI_20615, partial [Polyangiaceae bacterium]